MNIEIKDVSETRKSLVVTLDQAEVAAEHQAVIGEISKQARLPGFRPGKAPASMIIQRYGKEIGDELKQKVEANPLDHQARFDLAVALNSKGKRAEAVDNLIEIVRRDRKWNDDGAFAWSLPQEISPQA